jgi:transposase-like protein
MTKTRTYKPQLKAQVVLQVLTGAKSAAQICRARQINENLVRRWKQQFVTHAALIFEGENAAQEKDLRIADLERMVGRLTLELEVAKKVSAFATSPSRKNGRSL